MRRETAVVRSCAAINATCGHWRVWSAGQWRPAVTSAPVWASSPKWPPSEPGSPTYSATISAGEDAAVCIKDTVLIP